MFWVILLRHLKCTSLKTLDTIGNCQRPVFSLGVSLHMHKISDLWKFELNRSSKLRDNNERKNTLVTWSYVRLDGWFWEILNLRSQNQIHGKSLLSRKLCHFRGSRFSQCFINRQPLPITCHQVRFYAKNYLK